MRLWCRELHRSTMNREIYAVHYGTGGSGAGANGTAVLVLDTWLGSRLRFQRNHLRRHLPVQSCDWPAGSNCRHEARASSHAGNGHPAEALPPTVTIKASLPRGPRRRDSGVQQFSQAANERKLTECPYAVVSVRREMTTSVMHQLQKIRLGKAACRSIAMAVGAERPHETI